MIKIYSFILFKFFWALPNKTRKFLFHKIQSNSIPICLYYCNSDTDLYIIKEFIRECLNTSTDKKFFRVWFNWLYNYIEYKKDLKAFKLICLLIPHYLKNNEEGILKAVTVIYNLTDLNIEMKVIPLLKEMLLNHFLGRLEVLFNNIKNSENNLLWRIMNSN